MPRKLTLEELAENRQTEQALREDAALRNTGRLNQTDKPMEFDANTPTLTYGEPVSIVCPVCNGSMKDYWRKHPCDYCHGTGEIETLQYTNLDGYVATVLIADRVQNIMAQFPNAIPLRGTVGYSELGMHTRTAHKIGIVAFVNNGMYAYVLLQDGRFVDGSFHLFADGTFSVS